MNYSSGFSQLTDICPCSVFLHLSFFSFTPSSGATVHSLPLAARNIVCSGTLLSLAQRGSDCVCLRATPIRCVFNMCVAVRSQVPPALSAHSRCNDLVWQ